MISASDIGSRVMVRRRLLDGRDGLGDVIGQLVSWDSEIVTIETRHGTVTMPPDSIVAGKLVPPALPRRRPYPPSRTEPTRSEPTSNEPTSSE